MTKTMKIVGGIAIIVIAALVLSLALGQKGSVASTIKTDYTPASASLIDKIEKLDGVEKIEGQVYTSDKDMRTTARTIESKWKPGEKNETASAIFFIYNRNLVAVRPHPDSTSKSIIHVESWNGTRANRGGGYYFLHLGNRYGQGSWANAYTGTAGRSVGGSFRGGGTGTGK